MRRMEAAAVAEARAAERAASLPSNLSYLQTVSSYAVDRADQVVKQLSGWGHSLDQADAELRRAQAALIRVVLAPGTANGSCVLAHQAVGHRILRARELLDGMQNRVAPFLGATTEQTEQLRTYAAAIGAFEL